MTCSGSEVEIVSVTVKDVITKNRINTIRKTLSITIASSRHSSMFASQCCFFSMYAVMFPKAFSCCCSNVTVSFGVSAFWGCSRSIIFRLLSWMSIISLSRSVLFRLLSWKHLSIGLDTGISFAAVGCTFYNIKTETLKIEDIQERMINLTYSTIFTGKCVPRFSGTLQH